jgi:hypothetical protein
MINMADIVADPTFTPPAYFQILRSTGTFQSGGFQSTTSTIQQTGPVQPATSKEISMLPEGDRVGLVLTFWCTVPMQVTKKNAASDIIVYEGEQYRVLQVNHHPGAGFWRATATRMKAA